MNDTKTKVLFVVSNGRSGSTILGNALGEIDGVFHAGELRSLWRRGLGGGRGEATPCGCGESVEECTLWSAVLAAVARDGGALDAAEVTRWQLRSLRMRDTRALVRWPGPGIPERADLPALGAVMDRVYPALAEVSGASVIVDSSKRPAYAALTGLLESVDVYFLHLVRDPRAQAYSWRRGEPDARGGRSAARLGPMVSSRHWLERNLLIEAIRRRAAPRGRFIRLRYEDFVVNPRASVEQIMEFIEEDGRTLPFIDDHTVELHPNHTVAGNGNRFRTGAVSIRSDDEWVTQLSAKDGMLSTLLALPLLRRYGYRVRRPGNVMVPPGPA